MNLFLRRRSSIGWLSNGAKRIVWPLGENSRHLCESAGDWSWKSMEKSPANYVSLSPVSFLERAAKVYRDRTSVVYGSAKFTWNQTHSRCVKLASAFTRLGVSRGDVIAILAPNVPAVQELHFAVPMAGAVICTLNTRHDSSMISILLHHFDSKILFLDPHFLPIAQEAFNLLPKHKPLLVLIPDLNAPSPSPLPLRLRPWHSRLRGPPRLRRLRLPAPTPGNRMGPHQHKLHLRHHFPPQRRRLQSQRRVPQLPSLVVDARHELRPCLPMDGADVPLQRVVPHMGARGCRRDQHMLSARHPKRDLRRDCPPQGHQHGRSSDRVEHDINSDDVKPLPHEVGIMTGGSPPPPSILEKVEELGFRVSHLYGLTETYGPGTLCLWRPEWDSLPRHEQYRLKSRQGVEHFALEEVDVRDSATLESVPSDGKTMGEIMFRGNTVMSGYYKDEEATKEAFKGGWFRSGDLAVKHEDGYLEVKDRLKDVVISGGENVSTVEVETVLYRHPAVLEAAVVGRPDEYWGQTPCAFVKLKDGVEVSSREIMEFCRDNLPHYMAPKTVVFEDLPRTSTGKIQKFILREKAKALGSLS